MVYCLKLVFDETEFNRTLSRLRDFGIISTKDHQKMIYTVNSEHMLKWKERIQRFSYFVYTAFDIDINSDILE